MPSNKELVRIRESEFVCTIPELIGSLKLDNVGVFVQQIFGPHWPMNQLNKNQTLPNSRIPDTSAQN